MYTFMIARRPKSERWEDGSSSSSSSIPPAFQLSLISTASSSEVTDDEASLEEYLGRRRRPRPLLFLRESPTVCSSDDSFCSNASSEEDATLNSWSCLSNIATVLEQSVALSRRRLIRSLSRLLDLFCLCSRLRQNSSFAFSWTVSTFAATRRTLPPRSIGWSKNGVQTGRGFRGAVGRTTKL